MSVKSILFRCNAGHFHGFGHVSRCLSLAQAFQKKNISTIAFALQSAEAAQRVLDSGCQPYVLTGNQDTDFAYFVQETRPDILILDVRPPLPLDILLQIKQYTRLVVGIDDISEQRLVADLLYLPPVPAVRRIDWGKTYAKVRIGLEWMLTGATFSPPDYRPPKPPYHLLITMGGSDPWGYTKCLTPLIADACAAINVSLGVVIGPGFQAPDELKQMFAALPTPPLLFHSPQRMGEVYAWCDAAITPMCVTAYELARSIKPAFYICPNEEYKEHADVFVEQGFGQIFPLQEGEGIGYYKQVLLDFFVDYVKGTPCMTNAREVFSAPAAEAMAKDILESIHERRL